MAYGKATDGCKDEIRGEVVDQVVSTSIQVVDPGIKLINPVDAGFHKSDWEMLRSQKPRRMYHFLTRGKEPKCKKLVLKFQRSRDEILLWELHTNVANSTTRGK